MLTLVALAREAAKLALLRRSAGKMASLAAQAAQDAPPSLNW